MPKFIFVVGGVMSGVGKGAACASIGRILKGRGYSVTALKIDPYINVDAGTMNPVEHGEVFVTKDGDETDQDIGNYERFLDIDITKVNYMTTGRVYQTVIQRERNLEYGGKTVEVVPHVPQEVIRRILAAQRNAKSDFTLIEIGGTVGEYQNVLFLEALRMLKMQRPKDVMTILVSYLPIPSKVGEMKTKPTQYAVRTLNSAGIQPDMILARADRAMDEPRRRKLAVHCSVDEDMVVSAPDVESIYAIPLNFEKEDLGGKILRRFRMRTKKRDLREWQKMVKSISSAKKPVRIGIVGKYFSTGVFTLSDSYLSVIEAIKHAAWKQGAKPELTWLNSEDYEKNPAKLKELSKFDGVLVPGGYGSRGVEGILRAVRYCREKKIPYFGLCYGMQMAVIEFARNVAGMRGANTEEVDKDTKFPVIHVMHEQEAVLRNQRMGGSQRLGDYPCVIADGTVAKRCYGEVVIRERHRHRYEVNNEHVERLQKAGLVFSGASPDGRLMEMIELKKHPFFVGVQFHPEYKSRPLRPHPLFLGFIKAAVANAR